jgi:hypothetical protein
MPTKGSGDQQLCSRTTKPRRQLAHRRSSWTTTASEFLRVLTKYGPKLVRLAILIGEACHRL